MELSDFHKLTITVLKQCFPKLKPKVINYRDYQKFRNDEFRAQLDNEILKHDINNMEYQHFHRNFKQACPYETKISQSKSREIYDKKFTQGNYKTF